MRGMDKAAYNRPEEKYTVNIKLDDVCTLKIKARTMIDIAYHDAAEALTDELRSCKSPRRMNGRAIGMRSCTIYTKTTLVARFCIS